MLIRLCVIWLVLFVAWLVMRLKLVSQSEQLGPVMAFWDQLQDGATDFATGIGGFAVDSMKAGREFGQLNFGEGLSIVVGSFQEDLLGEALVGAIGPEGIGGTLIGAIPESVRKPLGTVVDPVLGYFEWSMQEAC